MTTTPLPSRPARIRPYGTRRGVTHRQTLQLTDSAALTVTFEVTLRGGRGFTDPAEVLETLRQVADRLAGATLDPVPGHPGAGTTPATATRWTQRSGHEPGATVTASDDPEPADLVSIMPDSREVWRRGERVALTRVEYDLLQFLALHPRIVFTRGQLLESVWGFAHAGQRTVDVHIRRLRAKLGGSLVTTVRGVGYRLADEAAVRLMPH